MLHRYIVAGRRAFFGALILGFSLSARAQAVPVFANGQGVSCQTCHTTFPAMTPYGMMTMMTNFQNLDYKKQRLAFPFALRSQIVSYLSNGDHPQQTVVNTLSVLGGGFLGKNFTWYGEQPVVDTGSPGVTEQLWVSWNGLFHGTNSLQVGKAHAWFPFMPAHGWSLSDYLLATQDSGQNSFEPRGSRWGYTFNGMSNEFMYALSYTTSVEPIQHAFDFSRAAGNRVLDFNVSYGGMAEPWTVGLVAMRGTAPLFDPVSAALADTDLFSREGLYFSYQTPKWFLQTMYYHGNDSQPDIGAAPAPFNAGMIEYTRNLTAKDYVLARFDVASSDTLNRHYVLDYAHNFVPNLKTTLEIGMASGNHPAFGLALDWAGPWQAGTRFTTNLQTVALNPTAATAQPSAAPASAAPAPATPVPATPTPAGTPPANPNNGAKLVQAYGCAGCHGAGLKGGGIGPKLYGIERLLTPEQIADFIAHPKPPMPNFGLSETQRRDIAAYLSGLDGGKDANAPVVTFNPSPPVDQATITVRFSGTPPTDVSILPIMQMGASSMQTRVVHLQPSPGDPHLFTGKVVFSMGGPWTVRVQYDGKTMDVPINVGS